MSFFETKNRKELTKTLFKIIFLKSFFIILVFFILALMNCSSVEERFIEACADGDMQKVKELEPKIKSINSKEERGWSAITAASSQGQIEIVKYLISKKANVNSRNNLGDTALYRATTNNHIDIVKLLFENGASLSIKDNKGETPLMKAAKKGYPDLTKFFLEKKVNPNEIKLPKIDEDTALFSAIKDNQLETTKLLIEFKADVNHKNHIGDTPLHLAVQTGNLKLVKLLLSSGAKLSLNYLGVSPLDIALDSSNETIYKELSKENLK
jgi:ankyrin repeat protein